MAYDKNLHKKSFDGVVEYERFYRYLRYESMKARWFKDSLTGEDGCWMLAHSGPGLSNTNCSLEVHWRKVKEGILGSAGSSGGGR